MKKRVLIIAGIAAVLVIGLVSAMIVVPMMTGGELNSNVAYVTKISDLNNSELSFSGNRYGGVVEMGEVISVNADSDKIIKETFVKEGDTVKKGDKLFEYDVEQIKLQLSQSELDLEQAKSEITSLNNQIELLKREKSNASQNEALNIDSQILEKQLGVKKAKFTVSSKEEQIKNLNSSIENSVVKSEVDGKIQKIASLDEETMSSNNDYITIATTDEYRVKAAVSEENIEPFSEGASVIVRSRKDESVTWSGTVTSIDTSAPEENNNAAADDSLSANQDSKYPVYIKLDDSEGIMVGQHVTIELGENKSDSSDKLTLDEYYVCDADTNPYVWCKSAKGTLEKRSVELGEYNAEAMNYEIKSGLTADDSVAYPEESLTEGMPTEDVAVMASAVDAEAAEGEM